ncbi:MAG: hypothetical protein R3E76_04110 [Planctomycetota bacterium]
MYATIYVDGSGSMEALSFVMKAFAPLCDELKRNFETESLDMSILLTPDQQGEFFGPGELMIEIQSKDPAADASTFAKDLSALLQWLWDKNFRVVTSWDREDLLPQRGRNTSI